MEQYIMANFVADIRKVSVLLTLIGQDTYKILRDLCDPLLHKEKNLWRVVRHFEKTVSPRTSVFKERIEFYEMKQQPLETISQCYVKIKNKAINFKFGTHLEESLKDKFIAELQKGSIMDFDKIGYHII